jgi:hypothetical protein
MLGEPKDISLFWTLRRCRAYVHLNLERRKKGKHIPLAQKAICIGFEPNSTAWPDFIPGKQVLWSVKKVQFKHSFPFHKKTTMEDKYSIDSSMDILYQATTVFKWITYYNKQSNYPLSYPMVLKPNTAENTFVKVQFNTDLLDHLKSDRSLAHWATCPASPQQPSSSRRGGGVQQLAARGTKEHARLG